MCELDADSDLVLTSDCVLHATIFVYKQGAKSLTLPVTTSGAFWSASVT